MCIIIISHARERMRERGATEHEVIETLNKGERFHAKCGRTGYRFTLKNQTNWQGRRYDEKMIEVYAIQEDAAVVVITVIVKYF